MPTHRDSSDGYYRLYRLDEDGHIVSVRDIRCDDDEGAIAWFDSQRDGSRIELWNGGRLVKQFDPSDAGESQRVGKPIANSALFSAEPRDDPNTN